MCSENKGADQLTAKLICVFVFAYAKIRFSHDAAQMGNNITNRQSMYSENEQLYLKSRALSYITTFKKLN